MAKQKLSKMLRARLKRLLMPEMTSEEYVSNLRRLGISIGKGCRVFNPKLTTIDVQNPHMLCLGDNVRITQGCVILTHDYSWSVLAGVYGEILGGVGPVDIGNNVFIGMNTVILKNTIIGDNVIIGAGSVVSGKVESNSVYAGNPARKIMTLDEFYQKRLAHQMSDVRRINERYIHAYGKTPDEEVFREYFWLFADRSSELNSIYQNIMERTGYADMCKQSFKNSEKKLSLDALDDK